MADAMEDIRAALLRSPFKPDRDTATMDFDACWVDVFPPAPSTPSTPVTPTTPQTPLPPVDSLTTTYRTPPSSPIHELVPPQIQRCVKRASRIGELEHRIEELTKLSRTQAETLRKHEETIRVQTKQLEANKTTIQSLALVVGQVGDALRCGLCKTVTKTLRTVGDCGHTVCHECMQAFELGCHKNFQTHDLRPGVNRNYLLRQLLVTRCPMQKCEADATYHGLPMRMAERLGTLFQAIRLPEVKSTYTAEDAVKCHSKHLIAAIVDPDHWPVGAAVEFPALKPVEEASAATSDGYGVPVPLYHSQCQVFQSDTDAVVSQRLVERFVRPFSIYQSSLRALARMVAHELFSLLLCRKDKNGHTLYSGARLRIRLCAGLDFAIEVAPLLPQVFEEIKLGLRALNMPPLECEKTHASYIVGGKKKTLPGVEIQFSNWNSIKTILL